jgi:hypothetical protein
MLSFLAPAVLRFFFMKKRLLDFTVNAYEPIFRVSGTVTKMSSLGLEF